MAGGLHRHLSTLLIHITFQARKGQIGDVMAYINSKVPNPGFHADATDGFEVSRNPSGTFNLSIRGRFQPDWLGNLSSGLSRNRINIISGTARKIRFSWEASLEIMPDRFATDLKNIDFITVARDGVDTGPAVQITLEAFSLGRPELNGGALYMEIKARDQLGFLGALLNSLAFYALFPERMIIETEQGRISDRFWIKGIGGAAPSDAAINSLRLKLEGFLVK